MFLFKKITLFFALIFLFNEINAQEYAQIKGYVRDELGNAMPEANVLILETKEAAQSNAEGFYKMKVTAEKNITLQISYTSYEKFTRTLYLKNNEKKTLNVVLKEITLGDVEVKGEKRKDEGNINIEAIDVERIVNPSGDVGNIIKTLPGVASNNELSGQYNVRGGNFDENLVYINDFPIYRPFIVRNAQQEGLSVPNIDLIKSLQFNAGGFECKYGDRLSSVLDITYKKPTLFKASFGAGFMGANAHIEGSVHNKFRYLIGARYRTLRVLLGSLDTDGAYFPDFYDIQSNFQYEISKKWETEVLSYVSLNNYRFFPVDRTTNTGTFSRPLRLQVYMFGGEESRFFNFTNGISFTYKPNKNLRLKVLGSQFYSNEQENFDVIGAYVLGEVETDQSKNNFGEIKNVIGAGEYQDYGRNKLEANVSNAMFKGQWENKQHFIQWGIGWQHNQIKDKVREWNRLDSAGYSVPYPPDDIVNFKSFIKSKIALQSNFYEAYLQNSNKIKIDSATLIFTYGLRYSYSDLNRKNYISPRVQMAFKPNFIKNYTLRLSGGRYIQQPFYRELRDKIGNIHPALLAQESYHLVVGLDKEFKMWNRPFKITAEAYNKWMNNLIAFDVENVKIRYSALNNSIGFARGLDFRLNGELVKGEESWLSVSLLQTKENIKDDNYFDISDSTWKEKGWIRRPTDQFVNVALFFQDKLLKNPNFKVSLTLSFGSGMPFGPPNNIQYKNFFTMPFYRRADIGFSALLYDKHKTKKRSILRFTESTWLSLEVFNVLGIQNTVSHLWISDVFGYQYAVPNYLTNRRFNLKLMMRF